MDIQAIAQAAAAAALAAQAAGPPPPPPLAGITAVDPFPQGCVDCHIVLPNGEDHRMNVGIRRFQEG